MSLQSRIDAFAQLGEFLLNLENPLFFENKSAKISTLAYELNNKIHNQHLTNQWFTKDFVRLALTNIGHSLKLKNLENWLKKYSFPESEPPKSIGVVMAGNIPLVGFHDMLTVLVSGNIFVGKLSSKDNEMLKIIVKATN